MILSRVINLFASTLSNCNIIYLAFKPLLLHAYHVRNTRQFIQLHPHDLLTRSSIYPLIKSRVLLPD